MGITFQRQVLYDYEFDVNEIDDFLNDPRLLALAQIKFLNSEDRDKESESKRRELTQMVAYLLNAKQSDAQVEYISNCLLDKVYTKEFNQFVHDKN